VENYARRGYPGITNPSQGGDANSYYQKPNKPDRPILDTKEHDSIGKIYMPDGNVMHVEAPKEPFGFNRE
jgi:hypothetical protein